MPDDLNRQKLQSPIVIDPEFQGRTSNSTTNAIDVSASNATQFDCAKGDVWTYTPTETTTITPKNPKAGQRLTIIILTSGTSSYTLTLASPFKVTGTLATGTADAKYFILNCISDGTKIYEISRTTAM